MLENSGYTDTLLYRVKQCRAVEIAHMAATWLVRGVATTRGVGVEREAANPKYWIIQ
jgi:hypothetical protein